MRIPKFTLLSLGGFIALGGSIGLGTTAAQVLGANPAAERHAGHAGLAGHAPVHVNGTNALVATFERGGRTERIYGQAFSSGATAEASVRHFVETNPQLAGVSLDQLEAKADHLPVGNTIPIVFDQAAGTYRFTVVYHRQHVDGVPVFRSRLTSLVRNVPGYPLVLVNPDVRNVGDFRVDFLAEDGLSANALRAIEKRLGGGGFDVRATRKVVYAGVEDALVEPRLADETTVRLGEELWLFVTDAASGAILFEEDRVYHGTSITGTLDGNVTQGIGGEQCEPEALTAVPYARVSEPFSSVYANANGFFDLTPIGLGQVQVTISMNGQFFSLSNAEGSEEIFQATVTPPAHLDLTFNSANNDPLVRSQVNAYVGANVIRDFAVSVSPSYPTLTTEVFECRVNRTDGFCPGNAWYTSDDHSINFCQEGDGHPNTAWSSVVYHEFGHHLVEAGGSGQGQYGEGTGDVMSTIILDTNYLGFGFYGDCESSLRNADNTIQYPCEGGSHFCAQLYSGCVWETRNELILTEPIDYTEILGTLAVNSILLHSGNIVSPSITIDWMTLDDDDTNILNGTPHYAAIQNGFSEHGMDGPQLALIGFSFPGGKPDFVTPNVATTIDVEVIALTGNPIPGTGQLHYSLDGGNETTVAMTQTAPNEYEAVLPAAPCTTRYDWWVSATAVGGEQFNDPTSAPSVQNVAIAAVGVLTAFEEDFETDPGWTVSGSATDGHWQRGVPAGDGDRGDPLVDGDGSGSCYLTDNEAGNSDIDNGATTLTSAVIDASEGGLLRYKYWLNDIPSGPMGPEDGLTVEIATNGAGTNWALLRSYLDDPLGEWRSDEISVGDGAEVAASATLRLRFSAFDVSPGDVVEAGIDGIELIEFDCDVPTPCPADLDDDSNVGFSDLTMLLLTWGPCPGCPADLDDDGNVGFNDLTTLLLTWGPCPP